MKKILTGLLKIILKPSIKSLPSEKYLIQQIGVRPKLLIVRQHNQLGDMLLSNSLFRAIKEKLPESFVYLLAGEENYQAVISNKFIDKIIVLKKKKLWNLFALIHFLHELRKQNFDLAIVPVTVSISFTSCLIARLSGSKYTIGPASLDDNPNPYAFIFDYKFDVGKNSKSKRHISDKILDIVRPLGIETEDLSEHILVNEDDKKFAEEYFLDVNKIKIGIHIGAGKVPNRWNVNNFAEIINYLIEKYDAFIYLTIGNWDEELLNEIMSFLSYKPSVLRNLPIPKIAAIIEQSDLFISNDTGIMHVAGSTNTPLIALFGPTDPEIWAPLGKNKFFIKKENDINSIKTKDVIELINHILQQKS